MSRSNYMLLKKQTGFTYLWLIFLVAIVELWLGVAVERDSTAAQRDREAQLLSIGHQFRSAIAQYHDSILLGGKQEYPASLDDLLKDNRFPGIKRYLRQIFVDPMTGKAEWGVIRVDGRIVGVHSLSDKHTIKQDGFDPDDLALQGKQKYSDWVFTYPSDVLIQPVVNAPLSSDPNQAKPLDQQKTDFIDNNQSNTTTSSPENYGLDIEKAKS